ncbi:hypothetical protein QTP88_003062 [Uroleucon formosanum]
MKEHFMKKHPDKSNKNILYFTDPKNKFEKRKTVTGLFNKTHLNNDKGLLASYKVSLLVAKCGKPHTIGETLILPAVEAILKSMTNLNVTNIISSIPLINNTVSRRIDEMVYDVEIKLCDILKITKFSLQLDESTLRDNEALLQKGIPITNCIACATDGAPAMIGRQRGFIAHLKNAVPEILTVHCVIHRQHLVSKNLSDELFDTMRFVINAINKIKAKSLNDHSDLEIYCAHLESLKDDMSTRFKDINDLIIPEWVLNPFLADIQNLQPSIQEELLEVNHNEEAKIDFKHNGYELFWLKQKSMYPQLWKEVELLIMTFSSTYLVEKGFSAVQQLLTKSRNKLEICERGDLRLMLTSIEPDIISLAGNHQPQGSH